MAYQSIHDGPEVDDAVGAVKGGANGFIVKTGTGASARRTLLGTAGQIAVANGDGTGGNPTASLAAAAVASLARADGALLKSGAELMAGALPMGGNKITGLAEGTDPNDAVRVSQLPDAVDASRAINTGTGLVGGGDLSADLTIAADIASQAESETGTDNTKLMTPLRVKQSVTENAPAPAQLSEAQATDDTSTVFGTVSGERLGQAIAAGASGLGVAQTWQNVAASRARDTSYQNTTGKPIQAALRLSGGTDFQVSSNNSTWVTLASAPAFGSADVCAVIPDNYYYRASGAGVSVWAELR